MANYKNVFLYNDPVLSSTSGMLKGVHIVTFAGPEFDALYVGPCTTDAGEIIDEIVRELGLAAAATMKRPP